MTILGFTGTRFIPTEHDAAISEYVSDITESTKFDRFLSGGCTGFDALAGRIAFDNNQRAEHFVYLPAKKRYVYDWWTPLLNYFNNIYVEDKGLTYKQRNQIIASGADVLVYCAMFPEIDPRSKFSGTWQTVRMARERNIEIEGMVLYD